ncbi:MAG: GNAT family N-acetyltransferase [Acidobacteriaceae bacterium]
MSEVAIRRAEPRDITAMAAIRAEAWETQAYWERRVEAYLAGRIAAQHALPGHAMFVAEAEEAVVGLVEGHRTRRHGCQGELEWINVAQAVQGRGIAGNLLAAMAAWFVEQEALRVCVNVARDNGAARAFYAKYGAADLKPFWMVWEDIGIVAEHKIG